MHNTFLVIAAFSFLAAIFFGATILVIFIAFTASYFTAAIASFIRFFTIIITSSFIHSSNYFIFVADKFKKFGTCIIVQFINNAVTICFADANTTFSSFGYHKYCVG